MAGPATHRILIWTLQPCAHLRDGGSAGRGLGLVGRILCRDVGVFHRGSRAKYAAAFFRNAFSVSSSRLRRSSSRSRARSGSSSEGSSLAWFSLYSRTQLPSVVSLTPSSRATAAIGREFRPPFWRLPHGIQENTSGSWLARTPVLSRQDPIGSAVWKIGGSP